MSAAHSLALIGRCLLRVRGSLVAFFLRRLAFFFPPRAAFFDYLRCNYHVGVCGCGGSSSNGSKSLLLLGIYSTATARKSVLHVDTRTNKREKGKKREESERERQTERPVDSTTAVLLHLYYIKHHASDASDTACARAEVSTATLIDLFARNIVAKKGYHYQLNVYVIRHCRRKGQFCFAVPCQRAVDRSKVTRSTRTPLVRARRNRAVDASR